MSQLRISPGFVKNTSPGTASCLVVNGESAFSLGDEGDVVVGQSMYTTFGQEFSGVAKFYYINQKFTSVLRLIEGILGDSAFHFLSKK